MYEYAETLFLKFLFVYEYTDVFLVRLGFVYEYTDRIFFQGKMYSIGFYTTFATIKKSEN